LGAASNFVPGGALVPPHFIQQPQATQQMAPVQNNSQPVPQSSPGKSSASQPKNSGKNNIAEN